jgi:chorismate mutase
MTTTAPTAPPAPPPSTDQAGERIGALRSEIDAVDTAIIRLVAERVSLSHAVGALRVATGGTRLSLARERDIISRFHDALGPDGAALAMVLLRTSRGSL